MKKENVYAMTALKVIKTHNLFPTLALAWKATIKDLPTSKSVQEKSCPKNAFLGLCEKGLVKGIPKGKYLKSNRHNLNKDYAITAVDILRTYTEHDFTPIQLWKKVRLELDLGDKSHDSQMHVVLGLWDEKLIQ